MMGRGQSRHTRACAGAGRRAAPRMAVVAAVVAAGLLPAGAAPASAGQEAPGDRPAHGHALGRQAAEGADLELIAAQTGRSVADIARERDVADRLGAVQERLAAERPGLYAGARLTPGGGATLYVKGPADDLVRRLVRESGVAIDVVEGRQYSWLELEERSRRLHRAIAGRGYRNIATSFDEATGTVEATVTRGPGLPATARDLRAALPAELRAGTRLAVQDASVGGDEHAFGGNWVRVSGDNMCTSGFSVTNGSVTGVTTAGHCTGINEIVEPGVGVHGLTHRAEHRGQWGDIEWKTSAHIEPAQFYASASDLRQVNSVEPRANLTVGEAICVYGRSSNSRNCGTTVFRTSVSCTVNGFFNDRLVAMSSSVTIGGDSGGGWTFGTRAYGSTKGRCTYDGASRNVFSVADLYDEALGVSVITQ